MAHRIRFNRSIERLETQTGIMLEQALDLVTTHPFDDPRQRLRHLARIRRKTAEATTMLDAAIAILKRRQ